MENKKRLVYGSKIKYPLFPIEDNGLYVTINSSDTRVLVDCTLCIDELFPNDEDELVNNLTDSTYKVTIKANDEKFGKHRKYFSDCSKTILQHNPEYYIAKWDYDNNCPILLT